MINLFFLPYAGASTIGYFKWSNKLDPKVQIHGLELPGRGTRVREPLYQDFDQAIDELQKMLTPFLGDRPFAFFGHSMGALLAYELSYRLNECSQPGPIYCFLSGRYPPHVVKEDTTNSTDAEILNKIFSYGGVAPELQKNNEFISFFLKVLRADLEMLKTYRPPLKERKLSCPIVVFYGNEDPLVMESEVAQWAQFTSITCELFCFQGGHFFINDHMEEIVSIINMKLCNKLEGLK